MGHGLSNLLNIFSLASNSNSSYTWQIDQGEIGTGVGEYIQNDRAVNNTLVATAHFVCEEIDLVSNLRKISKLLSWDFFKDGPRLYHCLLMI